MPLNPVYLVTLVSSFLMQREITVILKNSEVSMCHPHHFETFYIFIFISNEKLLEKKQMSCAP